MTVRKTKKGKGRKGIELNSSWRRAEVDGHIHPYGHIWDKGFSCPIFRAAISPALVPRRLIPG